MLVGAPGAQARGRPRHRAGASVQADPEGEDAAQEREDPPLQREGVPCSGRGERLRSQLLLKVAATENMLILAVHVLAVQIWLLLVLGAEASLNSDSATLIIKTKNRRPARPTRPASQPEGSTKW